MKLTVHWSPFHGPGDVKMRDLLDLTAFEVENPQDKLTQLYLWKYDYRMTGAKAVTAAGASLFVGLIVVILQAKPHSDITPEIVGTVSAAVVMFFGAIRYLSLQAISREFMSAHYLLAEIAAMKPFLQRYRSEVET